MVNAPVSQAYVSSFVVSTPSQDLRIVHPERGAWLRLPRGIALPLRSVVGCGGRKVVPGRSRAPEKAGPRTRPDDTSAAPPHPPHPRQNPGPKNDPWSPAAARRQGARQAHERAALPLIDRRRPGRGLSLCATVGPLDFFQELAAVRRVWVPLARSPSAGSADSGFGRGGLPASRMRRVCADGSASVLRGLAQFKPDRWPRPAGRAGCRPGSPVVVDVSPASLGRGNRPAVASPVCGFLAGSPLPADCRGRPRRRALTARSASLCPASTITGSVSTSVRISSVNLDGPSVCGGRACSGCSSEVARHLSGRAAFRPQLVEVHAE